MTWQGLQMHVLSRRGLRCGSRTLRSMRPWVSPDQFLHAIMDCRVQHMNGVLGSLHRCAPRHRMMLK